MQVAEEEEQGRTKEATKKSKDEHRKQRRESQRKCFCLPLPSILPKVWRSQPLESGLAVWRLMDGGTDDIYIYIYFTTMVTHKQETKRTLCFDLPINVSQNFCKRKIKKYINHCPLFHWQQKFEIRTDAAPHVQNHQPRVIFNPHYIRNGLWTSHSRTMSGITAVGPTKVTQDTQRR